VSGDDPLWMVWFILRWSVAGMVAAFAVMTPVFLFWTPPELITVIIGGCFVYAGWFLGAWWETRRDGPVRPQDGPRTAEQGQAGVTGYREP